MTMRTIEHWIGGGETTGGSTRHGVVWNPATGQEQAHVLLAEPSDVDAAVQAAAKAFDDWREVGVLRRARVMFAMRALIDKHMNELAGIVADEHGKTVDDAKGEITRGLEVVEFAAGIPTLLKGEFSEQVATDVDSFSFRQPLGVGVQLRCSALRRRGPARGCLQRRARRQGGRRCDPRPSADRCGVVRRVDSDRALHL